MPKSPTPVLYTMSSFAFPGVARYQDSGSQLARRGGVDVLQLANSRGPVSEGTALSKCDVVSHPALLEVPLARADTENPGDMGLAQTSLSARTHELGATVCSARPVNIARVRHASPSKVRSLGPLSNHKASVSPQEWGIQPRRGGTMQHRPHVTVPSPGHV